MWTTTGERQQVSPSRTMVVFTDDYEHARTRERARTSITMRDAALIQHCVWHSGTTCE